MGESEDTSKAGICQALRTQSKQAPISVLRELPPKEADDTLVSITSTGLDPSLITTSFSKNARGFAALYSVEGETFAPKNFHCNHRDPCGENVSN